MILNINNFEEHFNTNKSIYVVENDKITTFFPLKKEGSRTFLLGDNTKIERLVLSDKYCNLYNKLKNKQVTTDPKEAKKLLRKSVIEYVKWMNSFYGWEDPIEINEDDGIIEDEFTEQEEQKIIPKNERGLRLYSVKTEVMDFSNDNNARTEEEKITIGKCKAGDIVDFKAKNGEIYKGEIISYHETFFRVKSGNCIYYPDNNQILSKIENNSSEVNVQNSTI